MSSFDEWWKENSKRVVDVREAYRAGQEEMRERAAVLAGGDVGYEIADLPLEGDDEEL